MGTRPRLRGPAAVFVAAFAVYAYFMPQWADWNIDSRLDLVHAVVDRHTLRIDRYHWNTWDKAVYRGHYYSDKAPGVAFLAVPVYALYTVARRAAVTSSLIRFLKSRPVWDRVIAIGRANTAGHGGGRVLGGCQLGGTAQYIPWGNHLVPPKRDWALSAYLISVAVTALPSALFLAFLFAFTGSLGVGTAARIVATAVYGVGTVALPYSSSPYSHQLAAALLFVAFALLFASRRRQTRWWQTGLAGLLLATAVVTEYTAAILGVALLGYAVYVLRWRLRSLIPLVLGGAVPVAGLATYNFLCFGSPLDTGYSHDFCWSAAQAAGIGGFTYPKLNALLDLTVGSYRGLFFYSPFLLLAVPGAAAMRSRRLGPEAVLCVGGAVLFIVAMSAYWGWNGGRADGPRYLVPALPFLILPAAFAADVWLRRLPALGVVALCAAWSVIFNVILFLGGERFPDSWLRVPLLEYSLPQIGSNRVQLNAGMLAGLMGWQSLLPLGAMLLLIVLAATALRVSSGTTDG